MSEKVNIAAKLALLGEPYRPGTVARLNDHKIVVVKVAGEFVWHSRWI